MATKEMIEARKGMIWQQSGYRKKIQTYEFWGGVLDKRGDMLMDNATFTVAGGRMIQKPEAVKYPTLRWPGVSFSPMPDLMRHGGRGLLEGVQTVWEAICNLACMHEDALKWVVMPPMEVNVDGLYDAEDVEVWPGKVYQVVDTPNGQQVVRTVDRRDVTNTVLAKSGYLDQQFQQGSMVTDAVQGLPGYRQDMTYREAAMNLDQSMGVFGLMGANVEQGARWALEAAREIIETQAGQHDYSAMLTEEELAQFGVIMNPDENGGIQGLPEMSGRFHISGIQALLRDHETLKNLVTHIISPGQ
jgi:hypothetical protein